MLFAGNGTRPFNDTWSYPHGVWTSLAEPRAPSPRFGAAMAWDASDGSLVLFGGTSGSSYFSDTWEFSSLGWAPVAAVAPPPARAWAGFAPDPTGAGLILFGGTNGTAFGDTWSFAHGRWTALAPPNGPSARWGAAMVSDPETASVVLFGGRSGGALNDTWQFHDGNWFPGASAVAPSARWGSVAAFDPGDGYLVLCGGNGTGVGPDTWEFRSSVWTLLAPPRPPPDLVNAGVAFDPTNGSVVAFGGEVNGTASAQTWSYRASSPGQSSYGWNEIHASVEPRDRTQAAFAFDPAEGAVILFGGENQSGSSNASDFYNDTWTYRSGTWTSSQLTPSPSPRRGAMLAFDPAEGALVLFGGSTATAYYNDTWLFRHGGWTLLSTPGAPSPRRSAGFTFDPELGGILLFGGHNASGGAHGFYTVFNDTWLWRDGLWSRVTGGPVPEPRAEPLLTFDPTDGYAVMFGGYHQNGTAYREQELNSTWTFRQGAWTNVTALVGPSPTPRDGSGFVFDPSAGYILMFAGDDNSRSPVSTIWDFHSGHWSEVCRGCPAPTWAADHAAYDEADGYLVTQGSNHAGPPSGEAPRSGGRTLAAGNPLQRTWAWVEPPFLTVAASPTVTDVGREVRLSAWSGGGTPPWNVSWTLGGPPPVVGNVLTVAFSSPGTLHLQALANGTGANSTPSATLVVLVNAAPNATVSVVPSTIVLGSPTTVTIAPHGGTAPVRLNLSGLPSGCPSSANRSLKCTPTASGTFAVTVTANDSLGVVGQSSVNLVVLASAPGPSAPGRGFPMLETYIALFGPAAVVLPTAIYVLRRHRKRTPPLARGPTREGTSLRARTRPAGVAQPSLSVFPRAIADTTYIKG